MASNDHYELANQFINRIVKDNDFSSAYEEIEHLFHCHDGIGDGRCILLSGDSGTGKSTLIEKFEKDHCLPETEELSPKPVLLIPPPLKPSPGALLESILYSLGDPEPSGGTLEARAARVLSYRQELGIKLVLVDEFHDMIPRTTMDGKSGTIKAIKQLMSVAKLSLVLAGIDSVEDILSIDKQIDTRCSGVIRLRDFSLIDATERRRFATFVRSLLSVYPFKLPNLITDQGLNQLLLACLGNKRRLKDLLYHAIILTPPGSGTNQQVFQKAWNKTINIKIREIYKLQAMPFQSPAASVQKELIRLGLLL